MKTKRRLLLALGAALAAGAIALLTWSWCRWWSPVARFERSGSAG